MRYLCILLSLIILPSIALAKNFDESFKRLTSAKSLKCQFDPAFTTKWDGKNITTKNSPWKETFYFDNVDLNDGNARFIANQGATTVKVFVTSVGIHFFESTGMGNIIFSSVFPNHKYAYGEFFIVMSRHIHNTQQPVISQNYGTCIVWE